MDLRIKYANSIELDNLNVNLTPLKQGMMTSTEYQCHFTSIKSKA